MGAINLNYPYNQPDNETKLLIYIYKDEDNNNNENHKFLMIEQLNEEETINLTSIIMETTLYYICKKGFIFITQEFYDALLDACSTKEDIKIINGYYQDTIICPNLDTFYNKGSKENKPSFKDLEETIKYGFNLTDEDVLKIRNKCIQNLNKKFKMYMKRNIIKYVNLKEVVKFNGWLEPTLKEIQ